MISKNWSDRKVFNYCKKNRKTEIFNTDNQGPKFHFFKTKLVSRDTRFVELKEWAENNCKHQWDWSQWQFGFGNNIWFRFSDESELFAFKRMYEEKYYRRVF